MVVCCNFDSNGEKDFFEVFYHLKMRQERGGEQLSFFVEERKAREGASN